VLRKSIALILCFGFAGCASSAGVPRGASVELNQTETPLLSTAEFHLYVQEDADTITIRQVSIKPWYSGLNFDVNENSQMDSMRDVTFGIDADGSETDGVAIGQLCAQYVVSGSAFPVTRVATRCGGLISHATLRTRDTGGAVEALFRIPKHEISESGRSFTIGLWPFNKSTHAYHAPIVASYQFSLPVAPNGLTAH
jgi:hypothetical protein